MCVCAFGLYFIRTIRLPLGAQHFIQAMMMRRERPMFVYHRNLIMCKLDINGLLVDNERKNQLAKDKKNIKNIPPGTKCLSHIIIITVFDVEKERDKGREMNQRHLIVCVLSDSPAFIAGTEHFACLPFCTSRFPTATFFGSLMESLVWFISFIYCCACAQCMVGNHHIAFALARCTCSVWPRTA